MRLKNSVVLGSRLDVTLSVIPRSFLDRHVKLNEVSNSTRASSYKAGSLRQSPKASWTFGLRHFLNTAIFCVADIESSVWTKSRKLAMQFGQFFGFPSNGSTSIFGFWNTEEREWQCPLHVWFDESDEGLKDQRDESIVFGGVRSFRVPRSARPQLSSLSLGWSGLPDEKLDPPSGCDEWALLHDCLPARQAVSASKPSKSCSSCNWTVLNCSCFEIAPV